MSIVGIDEIDTARGYISWMSPMARALIKSREGDVVTLRRPAATKSSKSSKCATSRWHRAEAAVDGAEIFRL